MQHTLLAALVAPLLFAPQDPAGALAPDGKPGLGRERTAREYAKLLRKPDEDQTRMLAAVQGAPGEVGVLLAELEPAYRKAGNFELLGRREERSVAALHTRFRELAHDPLLAAGETGKRGQAFARLWVDARLRLRLELLLGHEREVRELRAGLALLRGMNDGFVDLRDAEAQAVARRVDLSASLLRALRLDLEALRPAEGGPDPAWTARLVELAKERDADARRDGLDALRGALEARMASMREALFTPGLRKKLARELDVREAGAQEARRRVQELLPLIPDTEEGKNAPPELEEMPKLHRYGLALRVAVEGLAHDLLNADLCYWAGLSADFFRTRQESRAWFDRFLALRGIRSHDGRSYREKYIGRELTEHEQYALSIVQQTGPGPLGR